MRDWFNQNRGMTFGVAACAVAVALFLVVMQVMGGRRTFADKLPDSFFTTDDGKTFFVANSENVPPFEFKNQIAVHAYVFECDGKRFVGFLERYTPEARKTIIAQKYSSFELETYGRELKKPGDAKWVKASDADALARVTDVKCPDGHGTPEPVEP